MTKTLKEIITAKEVWKPVLNLHRFWRFYSLVFSAFNDQYKLYQTLDRVFHQVSISEWVKKTRQRVVFQHTSPCLDILMKHSSSSLIYYFSNWFEICHIK